MRPSLNRSIQVFTGFFTPGVVVIFVMGMFWSKASSAGALSAAIGSALFSLALKFLWPELPFMDRVGLVFLLCFALCDETLAAFVKIIFKKRINEEMSA